MQKIFKNGFTILIVIVHLLLALAVNYAMPSYKALNIVGAEVKRVDENGAISKERPSGKVVRDVYFIYAKNPQKNDKVVVFRNEDTRWGFPFYMKFNSADVQAKATAFNEEKALVQVKYYGWRIQVLNEFSNVVSIKKITTKDDLSIPLFSYLLYIALFVSFFTCIIYARKRF